MLYMKDWEVCAPPGFSLGFEGDNGVTVLEVSTDLTEEWDLKVDGEKDGGKNIIQLTRNGTVYSALLTASMLADDGTYAMQVRGTLGDYVRHSNLFYATVFRSINASDSFPPPLPSEFEQMEERLTGINDNPPMPGENGYWMIWNPDKKEYEESDVPLPAGGSGLPKITPEDEGKFLGVLDGAAEWVLGGSGGVADHRLLANRDAADQHPMEAITDLKKEISRIPPPTEAITNSEIEEMLK